MQNNTVNKCIQQLQVLIQQNDTINKCTTSSHTAMVVFLCHIVWLTVKQPYPLTTGVVDPPSSDITILLVPLPILHAKVYKKYVQQE